MGRVTIFAKGNLDVRDSLHALRHGDRVLWNGLNSLVRERFPETSLRIRHEVWTRSDALLEATGEIPADLAGRTLGLGAYSAASQFSTAVFDVAADVVVLSVQPDIFTNAARHRRAGYLFHPHNYGAWSPGDRAWFREEFALIPRLDVAASMRNFEEIIYRIRAAFSGPILIYNLSFLDPGETLHSYEGVPETLSTRIRRFNVALTELSRSTGVSVIDVDALVARAGADRLKTDVTHLTAEGCRHVAEEVARVLEELGCLPAEDIPSTSA